MVCERDNVDDDEDDDSEDDEDLSWSEVFLYLFQVSQPVSQNTIFVSQWSFSSRNLAYYPNFPSRMCFVFTLKFNQHRKDLKENGVYSASAESAKQKKLKALDS